MAQFVSQYGCKHLGIMEVVDGRVSCGFLERMFICKFDGNQCSVLDSYEKDQIDSQRLALCTEPQVLDFQAGKDAQDKKAYEKIAHLADHLFSKP